MNAPNEPSRMRRLRRSSIKQSPRLIELKFLWRYAKPSPRRRDTEPGAFNFITVRAPHIPRSRNRARQPYLPSARPKDCIWLLRRCATTTKAVSLLRPRRPAPTSTPASPASECNLLRDENRLARMIEGTPVFHYQAVGDV